MARITLEQAKAFCAKRGHGALVITSMRYLELADGNEELATLIAEYYRGTGYEKEYTVGKVVREFWLAMDGRLSEQPEVVRCVGCDHRNYCERTLLLSVGDPDTGDREWGRAQLDYCSYGERAGKERDDGGVD